MAMREYLSKMKQCVDILAAAGHKVSNEDHILYILSGLGSEYDPVIVPVTTRADPYSLSDLWSLLISFENRLEITSLVNTDGTQPTANLTYQRNQNKKPPQQQHRLNNSQQQSPQHFNGGRGGRGGHRGRGGRYYNNYGCVQCQLCGKMGHTVQRCYFRFDSTFTRQSNQARNNGNGDQ